MPAGFGEALSPGMPGALGPVSPGVPRALGAVSPGVPRVLGALAPGMQGTVGALAPGMQGTVAALAPGVPGALGGSAPFTGNPLFPDISRKHTIRVYRECQLRPPCRGHRERQLNKGNFYKVSFDSYCVAVCRIWWRICSQGWQDSLGGSSRDERWGGRFNNPIT